MDIIYTKRGNVSAFLLRRDGSVCVLGVGTPQIYKVSKKRDLGTEKRGGTLEEEKKMTGECRPTETAIQGRRRELAD